MQLKLELTLILIPMLALWGCNEGGPKEVTATAYNSVNSQTKEGDPTLAAWGDILKPGMKAIAVSRDLIEEGLTHGTKVYIDGLPGAYIVRDKMNKRWQDRIDIYMGEDVKAAREWGKRKVTITWEKDL